MLSQLDLLDNLFLYIVTISVTLRNLLNESRG